MARADRRRATRPGAAARTRTEYAAVEETLFFTRLRGHAKIAFVFIALVFAGGFVFFGVGSGIGGAGLGDLLTGRGSSPSGPSVDDARAKLRDNPSDTSALLELSQALQNEGKTDEAISPLQRYTKIRPKDQDALRELASLYVGKATRLRNEAAQAQAAGAIVTAPADLIPTTSSNPFDQQLSSGGPIVQSVQQQAQSKLTDVYTRMQAAYRQALGTYRRLAALMPKDPSIQLQLADAAVNGGNNAAAIAAYQQFLKLAPDDPTAPLVRKEIKRLQQGATAVGG